MAEWANPLHADLDHILEHGGELFGELEGARIFITGGTGFVGRWMLESLIWADAKLDLGVEAVVLSRDPGRLAARHPHLATARPITMLAGDVLNFESPEGEFTHALHMATETNQVVAHAKPTLEFDTAVDGTRHMLRFAESAGVGKFLYTSSGAIYGTQPLTCDHVSETDVFAPLADNAKAAYGHGKRAAEFLCSAAHLETGIETTIARLFSFVGPYLDINAGYAVGNFIRDALAGNTITIGGDGTPRRSYLYAADLALWLWTILLKGRPGQAYNTGSDQDLSILELAETVSRVLCPDAHIEVAQTPVPGALPARYVPDITRARDELGLSPIISLEDGIGRTAEWHRNANRTGSEA
ncbi:MAG TPA: NAD-dependent epimerase/dehydratase family protein [Coriobacteriia bacterium]|nr:NAD-dependent epimerase/dehydratase family protein [Coriobacteriia bacterium]